MAAKELKGWAGPDGEIGIYVREQREMRLLSYEAQPDDILEHANHEQDTARGGYADRQVVELVQNAADQLSDGVGGRIEVRLTDGFLYCADDGEPFDTAGVRALLFSYLSPKRGNDKIGRFGIGFKSVLRVTSRPEVFSRAGSFRFDADWAAERIRSVVPSADRTPILRIADPLDPREALSRDSTLRALMNWSTNIVRLPLSEQMVVNLSQQMEAFRAEFLLFVDHVKQMDLIDESANLIRKLRLSRSAGRIRLNDNGKKTEWRVFSHVHPLSEIARADSRTLDQGQTVPIAWAAPLDSRNDVQEFWAFFPTQTSSYVSGILNAFWKTNEDRQSLLPGPYNDELLEGAAKLIAESLPALSTLENPVAHLDALPRREEAGDNSHGRHLRRALNATLHDARVIPDQNGTLRQISDIQVTPAALTPGQRVLQEPAETWASYEHRPVQWLHHSALANERLSAIARINDRGETQRGELVRATVAEWIEALVEAGIEEDDAVGASKAALQVAAQLKEAGAVGEVSEFGEILLTSRGRWVRLDPRSVFFDSEEEDAGDVPTVHPDLEADPPTYQALQQFGIQRPSPEIAFAKVAERVLDPDRKAMRGDYGRFWQLAREVKPEVACNQIQEHPSWAYELPVRTMTEDPDQWIRFEFVMLPGPIVPGDLNRDGRYAVNLDFHQQDRELLVMLGAVDAPESDHPHAGTDMTYAAWPKVLKDYDKECADDFARHAEGNPRFTHLVFREMICSGPLGAFASLSPAGQVKFTTALLDLESTFRVWTMRHETRRKYGARNYPSLSVALLRKHGRIAMGSGSARLSDGLGHEPDNREVQLHLLRHEQTRRIRQAFPDLATTFDGQTRAIGSDERIPITDGWPGLAELPLHEDDRDIEIVRCDEIRVVGGERLRYDCVRADGALLVIRDLTPEEEMRCVLRELRLEIGENGDPEDYLNIEYLLERREDNWVEQARSRIRDCTTDAERLLEAVGEENLIAGLPSGLVSILEMEPDLFEGERVAEATIATFHTGALREYREDIRHLNPPTQWAGSARAVEFVTDLGFGPEWAGRPAPSRAPFEDVRAPYKLPPLHDYQERAVANIRETLQAQRTGGENRGLLSLPTGAGKTRVAVEAIIDAIRDREVDGTVLWIADRDELCEQAVESWRQAWGAIGPEAQELRISRMWGGQKRPVPFEGTHVVVATRQTLAARGTRGSEAADPLNDVGLLVVDEAHGSIAPTYTQILTDLGLTFRRRDGEISLLGLTATPYRGFDTIETARLVARYGQNRLDAGAFESDDANRVIQDLQRKTVLAEADHQIIPGGNIELTSDEKSQMEEHGISWLPESAQRRLGDDRERTLSIVKAYKRYVHDQDPDWPTLIFATSVAHAETVAALLQLDGIPSRAVSGQTEIAARRSAVEQFRSGEIKVLVNYGVFREGFDAPLTRAIIVARPVYSPNLYFQMIGRGLRGVLNGGSERCLVLDVKDNIVGYGEQLAFTELDWLWAG